MQVPKNSRVSLALSPVEQSRHEMGKLSKPSVKRRTSSPCRPQAICQEVLAICLELTAGVLIMLAVASGTTEESNSNWVARPRALRASLPVDLITHDRQRRAPYAGPIRCALSAKVPLNQLRALNYLNGR